MLRIAVDGYNLAAREGGLAEIEEQREMLLDSLSIYKKLRRVKITVVFDGTYSDNLARGRGNVKGVAVVYSKHGETADRVIKEMAHEYGSGLTVVTSDADIARYAETQGSVVINSAEFADKVEAALYEELRGVDPDDEDDPGGHGNRKKGPARRAPKDKRRKNQRLKKL